MSALVVATIRFRDRTRYQRYVEAFPAVWASSGGQLLAADEAPATEVGNGEGVDKVIVMRFPDADRARAFLNSPDYLRIAEDRDAGADVTAWIVKGF